jgi:N6-adenosine-specific RNA methylase IME4
MIRMAANMAESIFTDSLPDLLEQIATGSLEPFGCIYADPPWRYQNSGTRGAASKHYPTMPFEEIIALPIEKIVAERALLWLWTTNAFLRASLT